MYKPTNCSIWGTKATQVDMLNPKEWGFDSPRAGGIYWIESTTTKILKELSGHDKARLTDWLIIQRKLGEKFPKITLELIKQINTARPPSITERANRLLEYLAKETKNFGAEIDWRLARTNADIFHMLAITGSELDNPQQGLEELAHLMNFLCKNNWINEWDSRLSMKFQITVKGYIHLESLQSKQAESSQAFIAMWFHESMKLVWEKGIKPAITTTGYEPLRIDGKEHNNKIDDEIIAQIRRSRFLVADFSQDKEGARGGVYYEAGFAHGLNIPVIFTCRKKNLEAVHFDTRQFNHIVWETPEELKRKLINRIGATIGDGPLLNLAN